MSEEEFSNTPTWGGKPIARSLAAASARQRVVVTGTIGSSETIAMGSAMAFTCQLNDDTGEATLVFLGRHHVPGFLRGARCTVEGTAQMMRGNLALWNPRYRLEQILPTERKDRA